MQMWIDGRPEPKGRTGLIPFDPPSTEVWGCAGCLVTLTVIVVGVIIFAHFTIKYWYIPNSKLSCPIDAAPSTYLRIGQHGSGA